MPGSLKKRKLSDAFLLDSSPSDQGLSDDEIDISSVLTAKKPHLHLLEVDPTHDEDDDDALREIISQSLQKRNVKGGTEMLKKTKGKAKMSKGEVGGGSFQSMGLFPWLLRSLTLQGFKIPTPIQRLAIPALLASPPRDLVGMARTGSGKSLAYLIPLVQRLGGRHSPTFGARALILLPTRELALQILRVGKELARGWHAGEGDHAGDSKDTEYGGKSQSLRWGLVVGGEGLDEQFEMITNNPDVIIATPGRLLHLIVEMNLDLKSVQYAVFDEADRLFEMGFETALNEILHRLPATRQTLLFSATLPKSLVEFAKAGLQNPKLVRLDAESKISTDLKLAFFSVKPTEKDACLLLLLRDVIGAPLGPLKQEEKTDDPKDPKGKKKAKPKHSEQTSSPHQTIVFAATKHHVEYLSNLLTATGYSVSHIYGSLDQTARMEQMDQFRRGFSSILVVTDVAARGIDIPVLENVVNYDFPQGARVFIHRVGRTARAGRQGWAWSFVTNPELPYLIDLQLFLGRPLQSRVANSSDRVYTESLVIGPFDRDALDSEVDFIRKLDGENHHLVLMRAIMKKGHSMYERSKGKASQSSYKKTKEIIKDGKLALVGSSSGLHPVLLRTKEGGDLAHDMKKLEEEEKRKALLKAVGLFKPSETVLEIGARGNAETAALMKQRRKALGKAVERAALASSSRLTFEEVENGPEDGVGDIPELDTDPEGPDGEEIATVFDTSSQSKHRKGKGNHQDSDYYMSHYQKGANTEKGYSLRDGATFAQQAQDIAFDLAGDEGVQDRKRRQLNWDKKKKRFVKGMGEGADNVKMVKTESGTKLPATYRSGRFDEWKAKSKVHIPRVGEAEQVSGHSRGGPGGRNWKHKQTATAKPLNKLNKDYERKVRQLKKKAEAGGVEPSLPPASSRKGGKAGRSFGKSVGKVKSELKTVDQIRKTRQASARKKDRNARPGRQQGRH